MNNLRRKVSSGVDGAAGVSGEAEVNRGQPQADVQRDQAGGDLHVLAVGGGQDDDQEQGGAHGLIEHQGADVFLHERRGVG